MIRCSNRNRNAPESRPGSTATGPSRKQTSSASSNVSGDRSSHVGHARRTSSARSASPSFRPVQGPNRRSGPAMARLEPPAERPFQPLRHWPRRRRTIQRQAAGKQSQRELRNALDAQASRLCFRGIKQRTGAWVSASIWPMASVIPRSRSQRNMAVQRSVCRVAVIATEPRPMPSTAVTRQFTRPGRARSSTSTSSRDESSASSRRSLPCPAPGSSHRSGSTLESPRPL